MDFEQVARELEIDESVYVSLLRKFCEVTKDDINLLEAALVKSDYTELHSAAHSIKGASASLNLWEIYDAATAICEAAKEGTTESVDELSRVIRKENDSLLSRILEIDQGTADDA